MSRTPLSLLILKRLSPSYLTPRPYSLFASRRHSSASPSAPSPEQPPPKPSNLSARLSFVFDQIDAIEKERERSLKDETLQRIRAWREAKGGQVLPGARTEVAEPGGASSLDGDRKDESSREEFGLRESEVSGSKEGESVKEVELVHPWREWIELMERLVQQNYFDHRRKDEDRIVRESGFEVGDIPEEQLDWNADLKTVQTACLNFGKDRFDILRYVVVWLKHFRNLSI